jgi:hypothetical protein
MGIRVKSYGQNMEGSFARFYPCIVKINMNSCIEKGNMNSCIDKRNMNSYINKRNMTSSMYWKNKHELLHVSTKET